MPSSQPTEILLIEDDAIDAELIMHCLGQTERLKRVHLVGSGEEAIRRLRNQVPCEGDLRPDLILLDYKLPGMSAPEVLVELKSDPSLRHIPVLVISGSVEEADVRRSYESQASAYAQKPDDLDGYLRLAHAFDSFWLEIACYAHAGTR